MNIKIRQKHSKAMEMRFYWVINRVKQNIFDVFWKPGVRNLGSYFNKHLLTSYHKGMRPVYVHCPNSGQDSARICYSKYTSIITQGKCMPTGGYSNTEDRSVVCTKYVTSLGGVTNQSQHKTLPYKEQQI